MEHLSPEVLAIVCASLTGVDVFHLSHTSSRLLRHASTSAIWQRVVNVSNPRVFFDARDIDDLDIAARLKKQYASSRSMRFRGVPLKVEERVSYGCGSFAALRELPPSHRSPAMTEILAGRVGGLSMTISVWFSLLPPSGEVLAGGVLFGAQEAGAASNTPINKAQQPVMMSPQGKLYCSLLESATNVELEEDLQLETDRWYHLVLMYYGPVSTGFITPFSEHAPTPGFSGWYGFHGIVNNLRVWSRAFPRDAAARLKADGALEDSNALLFSLWSTDMERRGESKVDLMWFSRPQESSSRLRAGY